MSEAIGSYIFYEIAALLTLAAAGGLVGVMLRQPLIVSFIAVGIVAGPSVLGVAQSDDHINLFAELGVAVLLFLVGLKLDLNLVRTLGAVAITTGLGQVAFTTAFGFLIGMALGFEPVTSLYVAVALTFSSTIIIVKLLSDKREIDSLHGRIALGFLIVQDLVVVLSMIVLSALGVGAAAEGEAGEALAVLGYGVLMLGAVGIVIRYIANPLLERLSEAPELLVSFAIGWAILLAALGHYLGFGKELGGLLAGVSMASTPFRDVIAARLASLRDFLLLFFFIALGASLDLSALGDAVGPALVFAAFVLIGNPLIVLVIMGAMGYRKRTGFLAGLTVAQISEFSLIFMALGVSLGHVGPESLGLVTLVGLVTITASTYMITYAHHLYAWLEPLLGVFEFRRHTGLKDEAPATGPQYDAIVFGLGRYGAHLAAELRAAGLNVLGIDFDPDTVRRARAAEQDVLFGDASDPEFVGHLPLSGVSWVICTVAEHRLGVTHEDPRRSLLTTLHKTGFEGRIAIAAHYDTTARQLADAGADVVLRPFRDAAVHGAELVLGQSRHITARSEDGGPEDQGELVI